MPHPASSTDDIMIETQGSAARIRLNRPRAINSLTQAMVSGMKAALATLASRPDVICVILSGEGERGLCAGGDVRQIHAARTQGEADRSRFWREEFSLNHMISRYSKPYVALMDGIVMGGGVGIAAHGTYRIVTERTRLAMPETAIGYFPDVGATWLLPKAPGEVGTWLGLTGLEIGAADAIYMGLADYHVAAEHLGDLVKALGDVSSTTDVEAVIARFTSAAKVDGILARHQADIDAAFSFDTVEQIFAALALMDHDFARETLATLKARSPISLKLALRLLRQGRESSGLVECLEREFVAGCEVLRNHDFYEGVRAALIDKDRKPLWRPAELSEISEDELDRYFVGSQPPLFIDHRL